jgi:N-acetylmuramoyl-L-alanine amidase
MFDRLRRVNKQARNLGVKQAPFVVLIGARMPSILAEISFLTNRQEATLLRTPKYRQQIADALLTGVMKYQQSLKASQTVATR